MRVLNGIIGFMAPLLLVLLYGIMTDAPYQTLAAETSPGAVDINFLQLKENLTEGMLEIPENVQREIILYQLVMEGIERYASKSGRKEVFFCDIGNDLLYGDKEFYLLKTQEAGRDRYAYPIKNETILDMPQKSYKLMLQGTKHTLYMDINTMAKVVWIYALYDGVAMQTMKGNLSAYELIEKDDDGQIVYYPDIYVESDWDDLARSDNHLGEVSYDELYRLSFLRIPEDAVATEEYFNVASALKRYVEENRIEDVFYFDVEHDVICQVTNMIYTCRVRGSTMTLYIDIDGYNMKAHVYRVED
ncbi:MAG: hypothetical protein NC548_41510 [Lachnospiraceae bacterium]|nr:hypothetical protein [Lachnospiraceae bacterium]